MQHLVAATLLLAVVFIPGCDQQPTTYAPDEVWERQAAEYDRQSEEAARQLERSAEQSGRLDQLLERWEAQADRYDALLDQWEKQPVSAGEGSRGGEAERRLEF